MAGVQGCITLLVLLSVSISDSNGQLGPCNIACLPPPGSPRVCGSDGVTYPAECDLYIVRDCSRPNLILAHYGPCGAPCGPVCSSINSPVCGSDGRTYSNLCRLLNQIRCWNRTVFEIPCLQTTTPTLPPPCDIVCPEIYSPVCGSDGQTYSNSCFLNAARTCRNPSLTTSYNGECGQGNPCPILNCPANYDPVCGSDGTTYGNYCAFEREKCRNPNLSQINDGECVATPTPCETGCNRVYDPVCGSDGVTYSNECVLDNERRCRNPSVYMQYPGPCITQCVCN